MNAMMDSPDWEQRADTFAAEAIAQGEPTAWFERLYSAARQGDVSMPWDFTDANAVIVDWAAQRQVRGDGRRAVVVRREPIQRILYPRHWPDMLVRP